MHEKTTIRFWGGLNTIGGTIVSLEYEDYRLVFDFGVIDSGMSGFAHQGIHVHDRTAVRDFLELGRLKPIDGLYREEDIRGLPILSARADGRTAVWITHLHIDHMGGVGYLSPAVPVYMSPASRTLYEALHFVEDGAGWQPQIRAAETGKPVRFGPFSVTLLEVDHDVPGACALHIAAPDVRLLYTGDIRLHGLCPEKTRGMIRAANELGTDVALFEGTSLPSREQEPHPIGSGPKPPFERLTEAEAGARIGNWIAQTEGLPILNLYRRNTPRLEAAAGAAADSGRTLVFNMRSAMTTQKMGYRYPFAVLSDGHQNLPPNAQALVRKYGWNMVSLEALRADPQAFVLQNDYADILDLLELDRHAGRYIHSGGLPLGPYDPRYARFREFLSFLGLDMTPVSCSGHASPTDLRSLAEQLDTSLILPLHSLHPDAFYVERHTVFLPHYGVTYAYRDGKLVPEPAREEM